MDAFQALSKAISSIKTQRVDSYKRTDLSFAGGSVETTNPIIINKIFHVGNGNRRLKTRVIACALIGSIIFCTNMSA